MKIENIKKFWNDFLDFFSDKEDPTQPHYDPVHFAGMIIIVILGLTILFWLLWALLVFGGGIQAKIIPFIKLVFTSKTLGDFGYIGYPYEMGVFEGWITNVVAFVFVILLTGAIYFIFKSEKNPVK